MRMVNISNEKSMQSYTARCSRYKNKYTNLVCGKTAVGRNYNLPRDNIERGFSAHDYLGLYKEKSVRAIGKIKAIITPDTISSDKVIWESSNTNLV